MVSHAYVSRVLRSHDRSEQPGGSRWGQPVLDAPCYSPPQARPKTTNLKTRNRTFI